jgi:peptide/nickel transport system substrate-binding protein
LPQRDQCKTKLNVPTQPPMPDIAQAVQQTVTQAGVKLKLVTSDLKQVLTEFRGRKFMATLISWTPDYLDPHTNASTFAYNDNDSDDAPHPLAWRCHSVVVAVHCGSFGS